MRGKTLHFVTFWTEISSGIKLHRNCFIIPKFEEISEIQNKLVYQRCLLYINTYLVGRESFGQNPIFQSVTVLNHHRSPLRVVWWILKSKSKVQNICLLLTLCHRSRDKATWPRRIYSKRHNSVRDGDMILKFGERIGHMTFNEHYIEH